MLTRMTRAFVFYLYGLLVHMSLMYPATIVLLLFIKGAAYRSLHLYTAHL